MKKFECPKYIVEFLIPPTLSTLEKCPKTTEKLYSLIDEAIDYGETVWVVVK